MSSPRKILPFEEEMKVIKENVERSVADVRRDFGHIKDNLKKSMAELNRLALAGFEKIKEHDSLINHIKQTNENVEQTLINVLLAIRQNEYLQAWYPAQNGEPETKVVGLHPHQRPDTIEKPFPQKRKRR